jgi:hypothetical protein
MAEITSVGSTRIYPPFSLTVMFTAQSVVQNIFVEVLQSAAGWPAASKQIYFTFNSQKFPA